MLPIPFYEWLYIDKCGGCHFNTTLLKTQGLEASPLEFTTQRNVTQPRRESNLAKEKLISFISKGPYNLKPTTAKETKPTTTLTKQINIVNNRIKTSNYCHGFCHKIRFIITWKVILSFPCSLSLSLSNTHTHTHTGTDTRSHRNMLSALLWRIKQ